MSEEVNFLHADKYLNFLHADKRQHFLKFGTNFLMNMFSLQVDTIIFGWCGQHT